MPPRDRDQAQSRSLVLVMVGGHYSDSAIIMPPRDRDQDQSRSQSWSGSIIRSTFECNRVTVTGPGLGLGLGPAALLPFPNNASNTVTDPGLGRAAAL